MSSFPVMLRFNIMSAASRQPSFIIRQSRRPTGLLSALHTANDASIHFYAAEANLATTLPGNARKELCSRRHAYSSLYHLNILSASLLLHETMECWSYGAISARNPYLFSSSFSTEFIPSGAAFMAWKLCSEIVALVSMSRRFCFFLCVFLNVPRFIKSCTIRTSWGSVFN